MNKRQNLLKGIIKENPVLVLVLGTCPSLAVTTNVMSALGMGAAATIVLLCSNVVISALRNIIPDKVRIPCYIVLIAGFVTMVQMLVKAVTPVLDEALGIYLPLIVVNCVILGRAEMFANKNKVIDSAIDAVGMGAGFTLALLLMATIREVLGNGTWLGISIPILEENNISIMTMAPGGFLVVGILIAIVNKISGGKNAKKSFGCAGCPSARVCNKAACGEKEEAK